MVMPRDSRPFFFLHIPKTGGTSVRLWLEQRLGDKHGSTTYFKPSELAERKSDPLISGHYDWSVTEQLDFPVRVLTVLRDPVDQVRSHFDHLQRSERDQHKAILTEFPTIEAFAQGHPWGSNLQTQRLAGLPDDSALRAEPEKWLAVAKAHLDQCYWFGVLGQMEESIDRLRKLLGWPARTLRRYQRENVAAEPLWINEEQRALIERANALDRALYDYALARFAATE